MPTREFWTLESRVNHAVSARRFFYGASLIQAA